MGRGQSRSTGRVNTDTTENYIQARGGRTAAPLAFVARLTLLLSDNNAIRADGEHSIFKIDFKIIFFNSYFIQVVNIVLHRDHVKITLTILNFYFIPTKHMGIGAS